MDQEKMQAIAPLITGFQEDYSSRDAFFRDASVKGVTAPDGSFKHYAPGTIEKWYYTYKEHGFNGLLSSGRSDLGKPRKLVDYGYSGIKTQERKKSTKKEKLVDIVAEKDRKIQELRTQKEELERECGLLRGRIFLLMQGEARK